MRYIWFLIATFVGLVAVYFSALSLQKTFLVPLTGITHFLDGLVFIMIGLKLSRNLAKENFKDLALKYFMWFFILLGIFQTIMGLPHIVLYSQQSTFPRLMNWGYIIGHVFLYLGLAYAIVMPLQLYFPSRPKLKQLVFYFIIIFGIIITLLNLIKPNAPVFDQTSGSTLLNVNKLVGALIGIITTLSLLPAAVLLIYNGWRLRSDRFVLIRSLLMGGGLLIALFFGPLHDRAQTALAFMAADIGTMFGILLTAAGALYRRQPNAARQQTTAAR
jgi:hypothetical protein